MRTRWLAWLGVAAALALGGTAGAAPRGTIQVTVASANLSDNTTQAYDDAGIRILKALKPYIVGIQEFNYRKGNAADLVYELFGPGYHFTRERGGARLPNGVISRWPILESGQWDDPYIQNRNFGWATVAIPGPKPLHVVSVHLASNRRDLRALQARFLTRRIEETFGKDAAGQAGYTVVRRARGAAVVPEVRSLPYCRRRRKHRFRRACTRSGIV